MSIPVSQMWTVARYVLTQKIKGNKRYPLVLMLEPLFRCNLNCFGCGKIQYPEDILKKQLSVEKCLKAVDECGAPMVSIPGGEPLLHPDIGFIVKEICSRKKYVYLCTNGLLLKSKIDLFAPNKYLTFSVHVDGPEEEHDESVCRKGSYTKTIDAIKDAVKRGFRVTTNTTLYIGMYHKRIRKLFDELMRIGVEGMMVSPGYNYSKAPVKDRFLNRQESIRFFSEIFSNMKKEWKFNQSPLFVEFLTGSREFECTPWGNPTYNIFGWQKPCYLLSDGYAKTFRELINETPWEKYGHKSGNPECIDCMVHSGHEPTAVNYTFGSLKGFFETVKAILSSPSVHTSNPD